MVLTLAVMHSENPACDKLVVGVLEYDYLSSLDPFASLRLCVRHQPYWRVSRSLLDSQSREALAGEHRGGMGPPRGGRRRRADLVA
jgi:hypothetical protein